MTHILAFHAHPDDIETLAAGTLALLAANGHRITIATMTAGDCGAIDTSREETARIRKGEAAKAAAMIGADYRCAGIPDLAVFNDDPTRRAATELLRAVRPDIVITGSPADYHPDHEATSILVRDACFASTVKNYATGPSAPLAQIPHLYFMDPIEGRDRDGKRVTPDFAVDITAHLDVKRAMLNCHESQHRWVDQQHGVSDFTRAM
jgi:LmbE family N-acetylglucosaminyl deacetylase